MQVCLNVLLNVLMWQEPSTNAVRHELACAQDGSVAAAAAEMPLIFCVMKWGIGLQNNDGNGADQHPSTSPPSFATAGETGEHAISK